MKPREPAARDRSVFDACPVPLLEEDVTGLRSMIAAWNARGIRDLREHLDRHPEELREAIRSIRIVDANGAACRLHEVSGRDELLGRLGAGIDLDDVATLAGFSRGILAIAEGRDYVGTASVAVTPSGKKLDVESRLHIPAPEDPFPNVIVALVDRSQHRGLERKLAQDRAMLRALMDAIPDHVFLKSRDDTFLLANQALVAWAGLTDAREIVGKSDFDFFPPDIADKFRADDRAIIDSGQGRENIEEEIGSGEQRRWLLTMKVPFRDDRGEVAGIVGIVRDITSMRKVEHALRDSDRRHRTIIDEAPVGIFRSTVEGKLLHANPAFARMAGYETPQELIAEVNRTNVADALYWDPAQRATIVGKALGRGGWHRHTAMFRRRDGEPVTVMLTLRAVGRPGDAAVRDFEGFAEDITERTHAEEALAREHALLAALMDTVPDHIYFKDLESRFIRINRAHLALFGLSDPAQVIGKTDLDFFQREHAEKASVDEERIIATGEPLLDAQERLRWPDRPDTWVSTTKMPLRDGHGTIVGTFGISRDITERRRLEERNLRLAALVESSGDAIVGLDIDRRVTSWNRGAVRIYGYTPEEAIGRPSSDFIPPGYQEATADLRERILRGEYIENYETVRRRKDGRDIEVSLSFSPIRDTDGTIIGTASIARDISARKLFEAQAMRMQRLESLRILSGGVAHQFNNINAMVKGYLDVLAGLEGLSSQAKGYVDHARRAIQRAVDITERLQGLSGTATGGDIDLAGQIDSVLRSFEQRIGEQGVEVVREFAAAPPARLDAYQVCFIVTSLVANALDAMLGSTSRVLTVRCGAADVGVFLEVADTGGGILPEGLSRLFTPFYTTKGEWAAPGSPQAAARGVGLSLAVCQSIVSESDGRIDVDGGTGSGATFRVVLPAREPGV